MEIKEIRLMRGYLTACGPALTFLVLSGCAAKAKPMLKGEWRFVDVRNATDPVHCMTPPLFDVITFHPDDRVTLRDSLRKRAFDGKYRIDGETIVWTFAPKDSPREIEHRVTYRWDKDEALMLRASKGKDSLPSEADWAYLRPSKILPNAPFSGSWRVVQAGAELQSRLTLDENGGFHPDNRENWGYFRIWSAGEAVRMTTVVWVQGEGQFLKIDDVKQTAEGMTLTPMPVPGVPSQSPSSWQRVSGR